MAYEHVDVELSFAPEKPYCKTCKYYRGADKVCFRYPKNEYKEPGEVCGEHPRMDEWIAFYENVEQWRAK